MTDERAAWEVACKAACDEWWKTYRYDYDSDRGSFADGFEKGWQGGAASIMVDNEWKQAVIDALGSFYRPEHDNDPRQAVNDLCDRAATVPAGFKTVEQVIEEMSRESATFAAEYQAARDLIQKRRDYVEQISTIAERR